MVKIRQLNCENDLDRLSYVIRESFLTVAKDFGLTQETAPTNPAFLKLEDLMESIKNNLDFFVANVEDEIVGCIGIQPSKDEGEYFIERLAVLPQYRHNSIGRKLLENAIHEIKKRGAKRISIGIINENIILKMWYKEYGFNEYSVKKFNHLPFTVCFMKIELLD